MGLISWLFGGAAAVGTSAIAKLLADDAREWAPKISECLIKRAVTGLPPALRERFNEEWRAGLAETPGVIGKVGFSLSLQWVGTRVLWGTSGERITAWLSEVAGAQLQEVAVLNKWAEQCRRIDKPQWEALLKEVGECGFEDACRRPPSAISITPLFWPAYAIIRAVAWNMLRLRRKHMKRYRKR